MSTSQLQAAGHKVGLIPRPILVPKHLPDLGEMPVDFEHDAPQTKPDFNGGRRTKKDRIYNAIPGPKGEFAIETMEELGFPPATAPHRGGEKLALEQLDKIIKDKGYTATFEKPKASPAQFVSVLPLDRRPHAAAQARRLGPPPWPPQRRLLPHTGWLLRRLGGAEVFEKWLLDHEPACNAGNWQWLPCTALLCAVLSLLQSPTPNPCLTSRSDARYVSTP